MLWLVILVSASGLLGLVVWYLRWRFDSRPSIPGFLVFVLDARPPEAKI